jgi:hypothetical protein
MIKKFWVAIFAPDDYLAGSSRPNFARLRKTAGRSAKSHGFLWTPVACEHANPANPGSSICNSFLEIPAIDAI